MNPDIILFLPADCAAYLPAIAAAAGAVVYVDVDGYNITDSTYPFDTGATVTCNVGTHTLTDVSTNALATGPDDNKFWCDAYGNWDPVMGKPDAVTCTREFDVCDTSNVLWASQHMFPTTKLLEIWL